MKRLAKATLFGVIAVMGLTGQESRATAVPSIIDFYDVPFSQFLNERSELGADGNNRFIWDYYSTSGTNLTNYNGSVLWIVDPAGNLVATGSENIPPVGHTLLKLGNNRLEKTLSNIALHVNADNNTTLAFAIPDSSGSFVGSFSTWTFNAKGALIGASGPVGFNGLQIINIKFSHDNLIVTFVPAGQPLAYGIGPFSVWVLDEFGHLISAVGNQGPHQGFLVGSVTLSGPANSPNQLWHWAGAGGSPLQFAAVLEEYNSSGTLLSQNPYGPY